MSAKIHRLQAVTEAQAQALSQLLIDCVEGGASVSFMRPLSMAKALAFWQGVAQGLERGERALLVAEDGQGIVGTATFTGSWEVENKPRPGELNDGRTAQPWTESLEVLSGGPSGYGMDLMVCPRPKRGLAHK